MAVAAAVWRSARPNFLVLAPICVAIGIGASLHAATVPSAVDVVLVVVGAILAHAAVNLLNEWDDFRSGLDLHTQRTPFSGGSGSLPEHPAAARAVGVSGLLMLVLAAAIGAWLMAEHGVQLAWPGLLGIVLVAAYTPLLTRSALACLLAPGLGFGPVMVLGTVLALGAPLTSTAWWAAVPPLLLVSELLLVNQFPDLDADRQHGRRHLVITAGRRTSALWAAALLLGSYLSIGAGVAWGTLPLLALLGLLPLPAAVVIAVGLRRRAEDADRLPPLLGANVACLLLTLALFALGLMLG